MTRVNHSLELIVLHTRPNNHHYLYKKSNATQAEIRMREINCILYGNWLYAHLHTEYIYLTSLPPDNYGLVTGSWPMELTQKCYFQSLSNKLSCGIILPLLFSRFFGIPGKTWESCVEDDRPRRYNKLGSLNHCLDESWSMETSVSEKGLFILLCHWDMEVYSL